MRNNKTVFLVDLDNTLFDTEKIRPLIDKVPDKELKKYFKKCLFPNALDILRKLKALGKVVIFSGVQELGYKYQKSKIKETGIEQIAGKNNLVIVHDKHSHIKTQIQKLKKNNFSEIFILDDRVTILEEAHRIDPNIKGILMAYGKYKNTPITNQNAISYKGNSLKEAYDFLSSLVDFLDHLSIRQGLTPKQKGQLLHQTKIDQEVHKFTSDSVRFKSRTAINKWFSQEKTVYSLVDWEDNLMGLVWFHQSPLPKADYIKKPGSGYNSTFAIRMYQPVRGKGLAKQFMEKTFSHFGKKNIWLSVSDDNVPGKKLYEKFGFKQVSNPDHRNKILMILDKYKNG